MTHTLSILTMFDIKVEWYPIYGPKSLFKFGEKRPIVCCCTHEQKMNFEGFTQNGCYGNQSQPLEVLFDCTDAKNPCPFTKQDLIFKQAYLVGFCFVLFNSLTVTSCLQCFLEALFRNNLIFSTKPGEQIVYCHVTDVKMLKKFSLLNNDTIGLWLPQISGIYL